MTDETTLLPCPLCGSKGTMHEIESGYGTDYAICCNYKGCRLSEVPNHNHSSKTEAEAVAAWNARTERTCKPQGEWERVSQTQEIRHIYCECGEELGTDERASAPFAIETKAYLPNYCPNCGAKVVDE